MLASTPGEEVRGGKGGRRGKGKGGGSREIGGGEIRVFVGGWESSREFQSFWNFFRRSRGV
jgi:hypothetical protein